MKVGIVVLLACVTAWGCYAGQPGVEPERPQVVIMGPAGPQSAPVEAPPVVDLRADGVKGRPISFDTPSVAAEPYPGPPVPSIGAVVRGVLYAPVWVLDKTLDIAAGTLNAGGQVLNVGTGATLSVLQAGSGALVSSGEVVELGAKRFTLNAEGAVN